MTPEEKLKLEEQIVEMLKTVYDPEIPVDIYNLGLIYNIDLADDGLLDIDMTLTAPNCPAAGRYHFGRPEPADLRLPDHSATYDSREIRRYHHDAPAPPTSPPTTSTT